MAALTDGEIESWQADVAVLRQDLHKLGKLALKMEAVLVGLAVQLKDASAPSLLDSLSEEPEK